MNKHLTPIIAFAVAGVLVGGSAALAAPNTWVGGSSTNFNDPANWSLGAINAADVSTFTGAASVQPNVTANVSVTQIDFASGSSGYVLSATSPAALTLTGPSPSFTVVVGHHTTGTNTITADLILSGGGSKGITQSGSGTLAISGNISESTAGTAVSYSRASAAGPSFIISGANTYTGKTSFLDGTLTISNFGVTGAASNLGKNGTFSIGGSDSSRGATVIYNGAGETTDKVLDIGTGSGNRTISTTGATGGLIFTADPIFHGVNNPTPFGLSGDSAGNRFAGKIGDANLTAITNFSKGGTGSWTLSAANTYTGTTSVNGGTLFINGNQSAATGNVTVASSATLGGNGIIGGATTINSGGTLSPGTSPGTLTFNAGLSLANGSKAIFEAGDLVVVNGTLTLTNNWTLSLGSGFTDGGSVTLFTYGSIAASPDLVPTFDIANLGFVPSASLSLTDTGSSIVLNGISAPIPEPATLALFAIGGLMMIQRRSGRAG